MVGRRSARCRNVVHVRRRARLANPSAPNWGSGTSSTEVGPAPTPVESNMPEPRARHSTNQMAAPGNNLRSATSTRSRGQPVPQPKGRTRVITELNHVAILVRERGEPVEFYAMVLGGTVVWSARIESIGLDIVRRRVTPETPPAPRRK